MADRLKPPKNSQFQPVIPRSFATDGSEIDFSGLDPEELQDLYRQNLVLFKKEDEIPVIDAAGNFGTVKGSQLPQAVAEGYELYSPQKQYRDYLERTYGDQVGRGLIEAGARGVTLGLSDVALEKTGLATEEGLRAREELTPGTFGAELTGAFLPSLLSGGTAALARGGGAGAQALAKGSGIVSKLTPMELATNAGRAVENTLASKLASTEAQTLARKILKTGVPKTAGLATEGAIIGGVQSLSEELLGDPDVNAEYVLANAAGGAIFGGALGGLTAGVVASKPVLEKSFKAAKNKSEVAAKKAVSTFLDLSEKDLARYVERKEAVSALEGAPDELRQEILEKVRPQVEGIKERAASAKLLKKEAEFDFKQSQRELLDQKKATLLDSSGDVSKAVEGLRQRAVQASQDITEGLAGNVVKLENARNKILEKAAEFETFGTDEAKRVASKLRDYMDDLSKEAADGNVDALIIKQRIKGLDQVTSYNPNASQFDNLLNRGYKDLRYTLDDELKSQIPAYAKAMKPVAEDFSLLSKLNRYGDENSALRSLANFGTDTKMAIDLPLLKKLESRVGGQFTGKIDEYLDALKINKQAGRLVKDDLEQFKGLLKSPQYRTKIAQNLHDSPEFQSLINAQMEEIASKAGLDSLEGLTPASLKSLFKQAGRGDLEALRKVGVLEKALNDPTISRMVEDVGIKEALDKGFTRGAKNTVFWGTLGEVVGRMLGGTPFVGGALGAIWGGIVDKHGPKIAKMLVDKYATYAALERQGINVASKTIDEINKFLGSKNLASGVSEKVIPIKEIGLEKKKEDQEKSSRKKRLEAYNDIKKNIQNVAANPLQTFELAEEDDREIAKFAPNVATSLASKKVQVLDYLAQFVPKDPLAAYYPNPNLSKYEPSDFELNQFFIRYQAATRPLSVFENLKDGTLEPIQVETLKSLYPNIYQDASNYIQMNLAESDHDLAYDKKVLLSLFFGIPLDPMMNISPAALQAGHNQSELEAQGQMAGGKSIEVTPKYLESKVTPAQKLLV